mmetsp:Transcript_1926/g.5817  ORF Transcript_1926/g.5817 Transcript_1926/m.5817 type:complete len:215 (-) Transcript_1926:947-1591(-)
MGVADARTWSDLAKKDSGEGLSKSSLEVEPRSSQEVLGRSRWRERERREVASRGVSPEDRRGRSHSARCAAGSDVGGLVVSVVGVERIGDVERDEPRGDGDEGEEAGELDVGLDVADNLTLPPLVAARGFLVAGLAAVEVDAAGDLVEAGLLALLEFFWDLEVEGDGVGGDDGADDDDGDDHGDEGEHAAGGADVRGESADDDGDEHDDADGDE